MTLVSAILKDALRESNIIAITATPTAAQEAEGLSRLNVLVASVLGFEAGEQLKAWPLGSAGYRYAPQLIDPTNPPPNKRLVCNLAGGMTVWLPRNPCDGARMAVQDLQGNFATNNLVLNGNGRLIESAQTLTLDTNSEAREWFFRADLGDWRRVSSLVAADEFPFPTEFDDMFIVMLAMRLNPRYGRQVAGESQAALSRSRSQFRARYRQNIPTVSDPALLHMSEQTWDHDDWRGDRVWNPLQ